MENEFIGAIKIKDGLFIGDEFAAQVCLFFKFPLSPTLSLFKLLTFSTGFRVHHYQ